MTIGMWCRRKQTGSSGARRTVISFLLLSVCCLPPATFCRSAFGAGAVWTRQHSGTMAWLRSVYFLDAETGWAVGGKGTLLATSDGGKNWKAMPRPTEDALRDVYFFDARTGWLVCERNIYLLKTNDEARAYLLKTTDGGATWARVEAAGADVDARLVRVVFADSERGWVFGEAGALYATEDGGATWARQRVPTRHLLLGGTFLDPQRGWLVGAGATLLHTADGGATWRAGGIERNAAIVHDSTAPASTPSPAAPSGGTRLNAVSFVDARRGWAVGAGGAVFTTDNGGRSWRAQESNTEADLLDVKFFDETEGWAVGVGGTVLHTADGGRRWQALASGTKHPLERVCFAGRNRGWAVGFGGTIIAYGPAADDHRQTRPRLKSVASQS
ncbi:MAG: WD40/YVTN/BNR-like repeat-containing protein [Pyrinomonadaceae bacterium]